MVRKTSTGTGATESAPPRVARNAARSAKRTAKERSGLHAWLPYYAGYSEQFVSEVLQELGVSTSEVVCDPMNGSGTTTLVCQLQGIASVGVDLNPVASAIARAKAGPLARLEYADHVREVVNQAKSLPVASLANGDALDWFHPSTLADLTRLREVIGTLHSQPTESVPGSLSRIVTEHARPPHARDFLLAALLVASRRCSSARQSKNPTWLMRRAGDQAPTADVFDAFQNAATAMELDLKAAFPPASEHLGPAVVLDGNAKELPLKNSSVDAIITSPPYLTRIDYAVGTSPELICLGLFDPDSRTSLRKAIMGSTCITGSEYSTSPAWGAKCLSVLGRVRTHPSKASATYYFKNHVQYFRDAYQIVQEYLRVLKTGGAAVLVVQDSWYKDIHVPLGEIYCEMGRSLGAQTTEMLSSERVRSHLGLVNTRARRYSKGDLHEHAVLLRK